MAGFFLCADSEKPPFPLRPHPNECGRPASLKARVLPGDRLPGERRQSPGAQRCDAAELLDQ